MATSTVVVTQFKVRVRLTWSIAKVLGIALTFANSSGGLAHPTHFGGGNYEAKSR